MNNLHNTRPKCRERVVDHLRAEPCRRRLLRRREIVLRTRDYIHGQRKLMDDNGHGAAQLQRQHFLAEVLGWYNEEAEKLDAVLDRLNGNRARAAN